MKVIEIISLNMVCIITCLFAYTGISSAQIVTTDKIIPGGEYDMGDHFGFVDPSHPSDETPVHKVKVDSFYMSNTETSNQQFLDFLNAALKSGSITVLSNIVYLSGNPNIICYTNQYEPWYSISFNGNVFSMSDFRASHPVVGVMWFGAISYCNWFSSQKGLQACYNLNTLDCDFTKNGYRLPTEAEWEWAARGGHKKPYLQYEKCDTAVIAQANLPDSGDPY
ncbi:MAG: SUMF1/EgtB/PvdO family nonheme iron enzyme, partial [Bacteroidota bacterium]